MKKSICDVRSDKVNISTLSSSMVALVRENVERMCQVSWLDYVLDATRRRDRTLVSRKGVILRFIYKKSPVGWDIAKHQYLTEGK